MNRLAARLHVRTVKLAESAEAREEGMEGVQAAALAGIVGLAAIVLAGAVSGKMQELWARINGA